MRRFGLALTMAVLSLPALLNPARGQSGAFSLQELHDRTIERRAVEAAIWGMPLVSFDAMQNAASATHQSDGPLVAGEVGERSAAIDARETQSPVEFIAARR